MRRPPRPILLLAAASGALLATGCKGTGLGSSVRDDVAARMATTQAPIAACYEQALVRNRRLKGRMLLRFTAEPATGQFSGVTVAQNDLPDPELTACVVERVSILQLAVPQKTAAAIEYPLDFSPIDAPK